MLEIASPRKTWRPGRRRRGGGLTAVTVLAWIGVFVAYAAFLAPPSNFAAHQVFTPAPKPLRLCSWGYGQNCVIDGDTIRHRGATVRLADIDAPETRSPQCGFEAELGRRATHRLLELMNAGPFQVVHTGGRDVDTYGRKLRRVERDGRSLGHMLVAEGLARPWDGARRSWC